VKTRGADGDVELVCLQEVTSQWGGNRKLKSYYDSNSVPNRLIIGLIIDTCSHTQVLVSLLLLLLLLLLHMVA
jgi:hypothetical protein